MKGRPLPPVLAAALLLLAAALLPRPARAASLAAGDAPPAFSLEELDGRTVSLASFAGRPVVIAFFSTWCSRCSQELAFLRDAFGRRDDVTVLLVNQDGERRIPPKKMHEFRSRLSLPFPILVDEGLVLWEEFGLSALPTTVVVGADGRVLHVEPGFAREAPGRILALFGTDR